MPAYNRTFLTLTDLPFHAVNPTEQENIEQKAANIIKATDSGYKNTKKISCENDLHIITHEINIDEKAINSASAAAVRGVPTIVVYKKGIEVARKVGGLPEQQMRDFLKENL